MRLVNLTPHRVNLYVGDSALQYYFAAEPARVEVTTEQIATVPTHLGAVPLRVTRQSVLVGIPEAQPRTLFIVSRMVAEAARHRGDLVYPEQVVRSASGTILGARSLGTAAYALADFLIG